MSLLDKIFLKNGGPSERQLRRAVKAATQIHGDAAPRVSALERLGAWGTPGAAAALLRRFTVQVVVGGKPLGTGEGRSKQMAEKAAAQEALNQIERQEIA